MMNVQAVNLPRVVACNGSETMAAGVSPAASMPTVDQQEGTAAHFVAASVLSGDHSDPLEWVDRKAPNGIYVSPEMAEFVGLFIDKLAERDYAGHAQTFVETDMLFEVPGAVISSRPNFIAYDPDTKTLYVDNFKYGWRIVEPEMNWTLIADALSAVFAHGLKPDRVVMTIHQPRPYHENGKHRPWEISGAKLMELHAWLSGFFVNTPAALNTSDECSHCPALAFCPAARKAAINAVDVIGTSVFKDDMSDAEVSFNLFQYERASDALALHLEALKELAKARIKSGKIVEGYAVEMSFGNSAYKPEFNNPAVMKTLTGLDLRSPKLLTPNQAKKAGADPAIIDALTYRPPTGERLIKRDASKHAAKMFGGK